MVKRLKFVWVLVVIFLSLIIFSSLPVLAEEKQTPADEKQVLANEKKNERMFGLSLLGGSQTQKWSVNSFWHNSKKNQWRHFAIQATYGWEMSKYNDRWRIWFEGELGSFHFSGGSGDNVFAGEIRAMTSYDFLRFKKIDLFVIELKDVNIFAEFGAGFAYWDKSPNEKLIGHNVLGTLTYGLGVRIPLVNNFYLETTAAFKHASSVPDDDKGVNTDASCVKIIKYF